MIIFYLAVLITGIYWVIKMIGPEMIKSSSPKVAPKSSPIDFSQSNEPDIRIKRLETLLAEKSKNTSLLELELKSFQVQVRSFDKVKILLDEEIHRLREQNRIFRSELGLPAVQPKENSIT